MYLDQKIAVMRSADTVEELTLEDAYREFMTNTTTPGVYEMIDKAVSCGALKEDLPDKASAIAKTTCQADRAVQRASSSIPTRRSRRTTVRRRRLRRWRLWGL